MPEIYQAELTILKARIEAYRATMQLCAMDLLLVAEGLAQPNTRLLQVLNRLEEWSKEMKGP